MRIVNLTAYPHMPFLWKEKDGAEHCSLIVKAAADLRGVASPSGSAPIVPGDQGAEPSDVAPRRTGTNVIVHGGAHRELNSSGGRLRVGTLEHTGTEMGFLPATDARRLALAGTYDERWKRTRAPLLPDDYEHAYFDVAHPELVARPHLRGGEPFELEGFGAPAAELLRGQVPRIHLRVRVGTAQGVSPTLDLLQFWTSTRQMTLTFRHTFDVSAFGDSLPPITILELRQLDLGAHDEELADE